MTRDTVPLDAMIASSTTRGNRRMARRLAVQALYQWQLSGADIDEVLAQFLTDSRHDRVDMQYFEILVRGTTQSADSLAEALSVFIDRPIDQLDPVERSILLLAAYELNSQTDVPFRVVINEAVELAKLFGGEQSHKYVNGVLDNAVSSWRKAEAGGGVG